MEFKSRKISVLELSESQILPEITMGEIITAEKVKKSSGFKLLVDFGVSTRTVFANVSDNYNIEDMVGVVVPFITNLEPVTIKGIVSEAMIIIPSDKNGPTPIGKLTKGAQIF